MKVTIVSRQPTPRRRDATTGDPSARPASNRWSVHDTVPCRLGADDGSANIATERGVPRHPGGPVATDHLLQDPACPLTRSPFHCHLRVPAD